MPSLYLKTKHDRAIRRFHPWIFSGAVERLSGHCEAGAVIEVRAASGEFLGRGFYNPGSNIVCRMLTWRDEAIDQHFFIERLQRAWQQRRTMFGDSSAKNSPEVVVRATDAFRLVNAEGDGLPGLIVDKYGDFLSLQISSLGMQRFRDTLVACLAQIMQPRCIWERSGGSALHEEGLPPVNQLLYGEKPPERVRIRENGFRFEAEMLAGQKTGFYLDQRENRAWCQQLSHGRTVLNGFGYSGAFSVYASRGAAARIVTVDSSQAAIALARRQFAINQLPCSEDDFVVQDMFHYLRATTVGFDFIILDPPAFARRQKDIRRAARAYKDINLQAMRTIKAGGLLLTCSCSQPVTADLFQKILFGAAVDAGRYVQIVGQSGHAPDHPVSIYHPEGRYLKAFLLRVE
jgi:23S rRNA (cytosine1962-C5)-methyltransferase